MQPLQAGEAGPRPPSAPASSAAPAAQAGGAAPRHRADAALEDHRAELQTLFPIPPARAGRRRTAQAAGGAAAALLLAAGLWWADPAYRSDGYASAIGERREVVLADGSALVLDTGSAVRVSWHLRSRRVVLEHGRAGFDVAPAAWRPFSVAAGPARVRVVGTRFDVWRRAEGAEVSVYQGRVAVWRSGAGRETAIELMPGQRVELDGRALPSAALPAPAAFEPSPAGAWREGRLVFDDTPLAEAVAQIQRYHAGAIRIRGERTGRLALSGVFDSARAEQLLDLLPGVLPVAVERRADGSVDIGAR